MVQLPCREAHENQGQADDTWNSDDIGLNMPPVLGVNFLIHRFQESNGVVDLIELHGRLDQQANIVDAETDDLNRVLHPECIVNQEELVDKAKYEECEVC